MPRKKKTEPKEPTKWDCPKCGTHMVFKVRIDTQIYSWQLRQCPKCMNIEAI